MKKILLYIIIVLGIASTVSASSYVQYKGGAIMQRKVGVNESFKSANWSGLGMNYGHFSGVTGTFSTSTVDADMEYLKNRGINKIRIVMSSTIYPTAYAQTQQAAQRAKAAGMYVMWGACTCSDITPSSWTTFKNEWDAAASWAVANNIDEFTLGNEEELHNDDVSPTDATIRSDIRAGATTLKVSYPSLTLSYQSSGGSSRESTWVSEGKGGLDRIGFNEYDVLTNFASRLATLYTGFGSSVDITEWASLGISDKGGILDFNGNEQLWAKDVYSRLKIIKGSGIGTAYFFTYKDGASGVTADSWAVYQSTGLLKRVANVLGLN